MIKIPFTEEMMKLLRADPAQLQRYSPRSIYLIRKNSSVDRLSLPPCFFGFLNILKKSVDIVQARC